MADETMTLICVKDNLTVTTAWDTILDQLHVYGVIVQRVASADIVNRCG
jgi:hypothetical protein